MNDSGGTCISTNIPLRPFLQSILTYRRLLPLVEKHRPLINILHSTLSWAIRSSSFQLLFISFMSAYNSRCIVFSGLLLSRFLPRFQVSSSFAIQFDDLRNICPIHSQRPFLYSSSARGWIVLFHNRIFADNFWSTDSECLTWTVAYKYLYSFDEGCGSSPSSSSTQ